MERHSLLYPPFLHFSDIDILPMQHGQIENKRFAVEMGFGSVYSDRATAGSVAYDSAMFLKVNRAGPPQGEAVKLEDYVF